MPTQILEPSSRNNATQRFIVAVGAPLIVTTNGEFSLPYPLSIKAAPGSGGTILVEYRLSVDDDWTAWPDGTVSVVTIYKLDGNVNGLRFTALIAAGVAVIA